MDAVLPCLSILCGRGERRAPMNLLVMFIGLVVGIVGGMLPGITTVTAVALFVPFTFSMPPDMALIGLGGVFCGAMYGGANAAILINTPGTPGPSPPRWTAIRWSCRAGPRKLCYIALIASVLGGIFGTVVLMLFFEPLSVMALKFGSEAFFWMGLFGLSTLAAMFPGNIAKGLLGGAIGLALCTVGLDPVMGMPRFTFGCFDLVQGLDMVALHDRPVLALPDVRHAGIRREVYRQDGAAGARLQARRHRYPQTFEAALRGLGHRDLHRRAPRCGGQRGRARLLQ